MMSLFSSFDIFFSSSIILVFFIFLFNMWNFIFKISFNIVVLDKILNYLDLFFQSIKPKSFNKVMQSILCSLMIFIFIFNFFSIFPYFFPIFSQVSFTLFMALMLWGSLLITQLSFNINGFLFHFVPEGTPIYLTWFLFLIELVSNLIRPITLTVRLIANILAGHLLMILLSNLVFSFPLTSAFYLLLNTVELFVGLIQSYIFVTMTCLYFSEIH